MDVKDYTSAENRRQKNIFQIEGVEGIKNAESIINSVPNGSSIFIGPYDLSQAVGFPGDIWCDEVVNKMRDIIKKCELAAVKVGTFTDSVAGIQFWKNNGIDFLQYSSDLNLFMTAAQPILDEVRSES